MENLRHPQFNENAHEYLTVIRERQLDAFGHVNNAQYMVLFEEARWEMITSRGYGLEKILETKIGTVVLESNIRYKKELRLRENIKIKTAVTSVNRKLVTLKQVIYKEDGLVAAEATFVLGCFHLESRKLIDAKNSWKKAFFGDFSEK